MINISIIFVNFNTAKLTCQAIESVIENTDEVLYEIILVDNNSNDNSIELITKFFPQVTIIKNKKNLGFGRANNEGIKVAKGKYLFLLNTDTYLLNNAVKVLFRFMENKKNKNVAVVGGMLYKQNLKPNLYAGKFPNYNDFINNSFLHYFFKKKAFKKTKEYPLVPLSSIEVDYVSGADFFVRKEILDEIGAFDKRFFLYFEETELCFRIKKKIPNSRCMIEPRAKIVHISQGSNKKEVKSLRFRKQFLKSNAIYFKITEGLLWGFLFRLVSLITLYLKKIT